MQDSVEKAVKMFGGIDIVINNATALSVTNGSDINVTGTQETSMKNFDLMHQVRLSCGLTALHTLPSDLRPRNLPRNQVLPALSQGECSQGTEPSRPEQLSPSLYESHLVQEPRGLHHGRLREVDVRPRDGRGAERGRQ